MILDNAHVVRLYRRLAPVYDLLVAPFRWLGLRRHRELAIRRLHLQTGDTVLDLCCGTGLNFALLHDAVGPNGQIIGVDLSPDMLDRARRRAQRAGYVNVELVRADISDYPMPSSLDGAVATFGLEMVPGYDEVVRRLASALPRGGRLAVYGLKHPERWPDWLVALGAWINRPFGVSRDYESFRPFESVRLYFHEIAYREFLIEAAYLSVGEKLDGKGDGPSMTE